MKKPSVSRRSTAKPPGGRRGDKSKPSRTNQPNTVEFEREDMGIAPKE